MRAFTLVELLVVIAIIGVLIALLLPAVQAAREAARRMQCTNKLKQLALGTHNYHDVYDALPSMCGGPYGPSTGSRHYWSGRVPLLPFIEMGPLYDRFMTTIIGASTATDWWNYGAISATYGGADAPQASNVMAYICPSDNGYNTKSPTQSGGANYRFCGGDHCSSFRDSMTITDRYHWNHRGPIGPQWMYYNLGATTDGTSNTLMWSERSLAERSRVETEPVIKVGTRRLLSGTMAFTGFFSTDTTALPTTGAVYIKDREICRANIKNGEYQDTGDRKGFTGWVWINGAPSHTTFHTVLPPNSAACYIHGGSWPTVMSPSSNHSGGVNAALMDGSVRFITETIDIGDKALFDDIAQNDGKPAGPSPFGVWGAYGSRDGGESDSL